MISKLNILICEEDIRILRRLESWISAMDHSFISTDDGVVAEKLFHDENPDILIVSQDLNSMSGIKLIENIKNTKPSQAVVLMIDNDAESLLFKQSIDLQVDKYLNKPVEAPSLFKAIEDLAKEKLWHIDYEVQKRLLQDYKEAIDISFSVSKHDEDGNIFYVNKAFCDTTKLTHERAMQGVINPLNNPLENMENIWKELNTKKIYRDRQTFKFDDNEDHIIDITAVAIFNDNNKVSEYLVFSKDVSDVVYAARIIKQKEIETKIQKLEHIKEVHKIKDSFLTVFSHELKTPLNSIINFSQYVKKHLEKEDFEKKNSLLDYVSQIHSSGWNMLNMITNLIDAMKLRDGMIELNKSKFSMNNTIDGVLEKYTTDLENIKVVNRYKKDCIIYSDEKRIVQILNNLISNSIKYCKNTIAIVLKSNEKEFILEMIDDGTGFSDKDSVLNLFEQATQNEMTRTATGTGVGLYIVKQFCQKMEYTIDIMDSKELGGARVVIRGKKES